MDSLGFLTVVEHSQYGLFGGYLVLNLAGRPLEFHCTAPIKPNRAQEILYGPTLEAFLYGEQIGQTLLAQTKLEPLVVCTDRSPALAVREFVPTPLVLVCGSDPQAEGTEEADRDATETRTALMDESRPDAEKTWRLDAAHAAGPRLVAFRLGRNRLALLEQAGEDRRTVTERLAKLAEGFDLAEPFQRIRDAIEEAQQAAR